MDTRTAQDFPHGHIRVEIQFFAVLYVAIGHDGATLKEKIFLF
jgi:hypothetical protein